MKRHILTVAVEEYFHVAALRGVVTRKHWERLEPRLERNVLELLALLRRYGATATFFVSGQLALLYPDLIRFIATEGHEIASRGYEPGGRVCSARAELVRDLERAREALEEAGANRIIGYRAPRWLRGNELWILDALAEQGYVYDSSINPVLWRFAVHPELWGTNRYMSAEGHSMWEFPVSTVSFCGLRIPISGGNYIRQIPHTILSRVVASRSNRDAKPLVFYVMPWELDSEQPQLQGVPWLQRVRHYRRLGKTRWVLKDYFHKYQFCSMAEHLGIRLDVSRPAGTMAAPLPAPQIGAASGVPVTIVVPMFNEAVNIGYLRRSLSELRQRLIGRYRTHFLLVDDGSTDNTYQLCLEEFADINDARVVRNDKNLGVAATILRGIRMAETEIVCSIDSDGSYDPLVFEHMLPLVDDADMVTASPYHPRGEVIHVPRWRLLLSKTLSRMYSVVLGSRIYTFTSCCRVYRRQAVTALELRHDGFLGIAEMLIELKKAGGRIVEHPARLESRILGRSKMKVGRTILQHLNLLRRVAFGVLSAGRQESDVQATSDTPAGPVTGVDKVDDCEQPVMANYTEPRDE